MSHRKRLFRDHTFREQCEILAVISFVPRLCRALAAGNSRARRSRPKVSRRGLRLRTPSPKPVWVPFQKMSSSAGERPPCFSGAPAEPGERKGDKTMFKNHIDLIGFIGSDPETRQLENGTSLTSISLATKKRAGRTSRELTTAVRNGTVSWSGASWHILLGHSKRVPMLRSKDNSAIGPTRKKSRMAIKRPLSRSP